MEIDKNKIKIAVVIPYYNAANQIKNVLAKIPSYVTLVVIVNNNSTQPLPNDLCETLHEDVDLFVLQNIRNLGAGGAAKKGFQFVLDFGADIVVKVHTNDLMNLSCFSQLIKPIIEEKCDMTKGYRTKSKDLKNLIELPITTRIEGLILSFFIKIVTGYWNIFYPINGFIAIKTSFLKAIDLNKLSNKCFFETSLLMQLYYEKVIIKVVVIPAIYDDEK